MFAAEGTLLCCSCKSVLIGILGKLPLDPNEDDNNAGDHSTEVQMRVAAVDAIAEVKCPETNLNGSKTVRIFEKFSENGEIPLVSDRYDLPSSPKETTRTKKQKSQNPVYYRITWPAKWKTSSCSMELRMHWNNWRLFFYPKQSRGGRQIILHAVDATARGTTGEHSSCHWYRQEPSKNYSLTNFSHLRPRNSSRSPGVSCSKWSRQYWLFFGEGKAACWEAFSFWRFRFDS